MKAPAMVEKEFFNRENPKSEGYYSPISLEVIGECLYDADIIAYTNFAPQADVLEKQLDSVGIWKTIPAVKQGNVMFHSVSDTLSDCQIEEKASSARCFVCNRGLAERGTIVFIVSSRFLCVHATD